MNIQQAILDMAMKRFEKELSNPNSEVSKKFQGMLYGDPATGKKGLFDTFTDGSAFGNDETDNPLDPDEAQKQTDAAVKEQMEHYKRTPMQTVQDNLLSGLGTGARAAGKGFNIYNSLLGDALLAISQGVKSQGYDNAFAAAPAYAMGRKARGAIGDIALGAVGDILSNTGRDLKYEREKDKETELLLRSRPSGQFYDARKQLTKRQS